jgi:hypothetical protein
MMNKKTPLKAADQTLVQGAYRAAMGGQRRQDGMSQGMDKLMDISADAVKTIAQNRQARQKEGDDLATSILDTGGSLGTGWLDATRGQVEGLHGDYKKAAKWGKNNKREKGMQDLNTLSAEVASIKDLNTEIATYQADGDWSNSATEKEQGVFNAFMDDASPKRISMVDGKRVFEVETPDGWMSTKDIDNLAKKHKKDYVAMADIRKTAIDIKGLAEKDGKANLENPNFAPEGYDRVKATSKMNASLKKANINSLMHDDVLENGEPWITAVKSNPEITGMHYEDLGLYDMTREQQDAMLKADVNNDGIIQEGEKKTLLESGHQDMIVDALTNPENELYNEERTRGMMASYFTGFIGMQYDDGYSRSGGTTQSPAGEESMSDAEVITALTKKQ